MDYLPNQAIVVSLIILSCLETVIKSHESVIHTRPKH